MCAGTVVEPPLPVSAASVSVTSRSRSVAFSESCAFSARTSTLPRIGMVLRRSTTRCTWPSDLRSCARSTVTFIALTRLIRNGKAGRQSKAHRGVWARKAVEACVRPVRSGGPQSGADGGAAQGMRSAVPHFCLWRGRFWPANPALPVRRGPDFARLFALQLTLQRLDLFGERNILGDQCLDL